MTEPNDPIRSNVLFRRFVSGTTREGDRVRISLNWAFSRWARLTLTTTEMTCGDWVIPYSEIQDAVLVSIPIGSKFGEQRRLIVYTNGQVYQFVLPSESVWTWTARPDPIWDGPLPFPVQRKTMALEKPWWLWAITVSLCGWLVWDFTSRLTGQ